jgi:RNA polymerase sigma-70 factor (ECF subfamily)
MALQETNPTTRTPLDDLNAAAEFEAGLTKLMPFLRAFAQSLSGEPELAEDLAQGALANAWRSRGSFMPGSNLKAWLFMILRNEFYSHQRRAWRQVLWDAEALETVPVPPGEQQWAVELSDTACALRGLPDAQREALILVGVGGFSYEDAAALSSKAVGTMKSRVGRARKSLRRILDGQAALPAKSRPANGTAMTEILAQLSQLSAPPAVVSAFR